MHRPDNIWENGEGGGERGGGALRRAAMQTNNESKKNFSLTKEGRSASGYGGRWKDRYLVRPGPAFLAFCRPSTKKHQKKNNHRRPWTCSDVLTLSNCLRLYDRQSNKGPASGVSWECNPSKSESMSKGNLQVFTEKNTRHTACFRLINWSDEEESLYRARQSIG